MGVEFEINPMAIVDNIIAFGNQGMGQIMWQLFFGGGWIVVVILLLWVIYLAWLNMRQGKYASQWEWVILAIDVPKENEQTPKAVENIFAAVAGAQSNPNLIEKYWEGKVQESFSFELVSLEGYVQFLIRTPVHFRDLIEAAIYAQYPDAEITEVEDYTKDYKDLKFPNKKYNLWGTEMVLVKDYPYPIRTYPEFEHSLTQSFIDPMAGLLEILSRFGPGEQVWLQLVVTPLKPPGWGNKAEEIVKGIMGDEYRAPQTKLDKIVNKPIDFIGKVGNSLANAVGAGLESSTNETKEDALKFFKMSPGTRNVLERIENKISKHAFRVKFRLVYLGENQPFHKGRGVAAVIGAIQQFNTADANGFKPGSQTKTSADYYLTKSRVAWRQRRILKNYIKRSNYYGESVHNMLMSSEELASIWHFPNINVKATSVEKIVAKKAASPARLPYSEREINARKPEPEGPASENSETPEAASLPVDIGLDKDLNEAGGKEAPPPNLPVV